MKHNFEDILAFVYVSRFKSFKKASISLKTSTAVISGRISRLEAALETSLLLRTTREVSLTSEGEKFFAYCQSFVTKFEGLDDFLDTSKEISGVLKIALPPYFSRHYIVPYFVEFLTLYPKLVLDIILTENPINIISERVDLQIRIQIPEEEDLETSFLLSNKKIICASKDYVAKNFPIKSPRDLLDHNCIVFGENDVWSFKHDKTGDEVTLSDMAGNITCNNGEIIKDLVLAGIGITLKSSCDIQEELRDGKIINLLEDYDVVNRTKFYAVFPAQRSKSPKINAFINFYKDKLKDLSL